MVFLGLTKPNPASRRVAMDHGAQRGYNYPEPHVGATRAPPHAPTHDGTDDVKWRVTDGPCASMPYARDVNFVRVGSGAGDYAKAKGMMRRWSHFQLGWSEVTPDTGVEPGNLVCVCANVLGVWIRNPLRVVYRAEESKPARKNADDGVKVRFVFAHGCLAGHLLAGEESFVVERRDDDSVWYGIRTFSRPAHPLALVTYPAVRLLQRKFAVDSMRVMREGMAKDGGTGVDRA